MSDGSGGSTSARAQLPPGQRDTSARLDVLAAILLSAATVLTAWSAFQNAKWSGVQATRFSQASASRTESVRASTQAGQQAVVDAATFTAWLTATDQGQDHLAGLIAERFRPEFKVAFDQWEATSPLGNPEAASTPLALPSYQLAETGRSKALDAVATSQFEQATTANQRADNYVLLTVVYSIVLFFAGVSARLGSPGLRRGMLAAAGLVLAATVVVTATFPVTV